MTVSDYALELNITESELLSKCKERNIDTIKGYYYPTKKNNMVKDFYQ